MESIAHDFFCFMSKLIWPLFIYYPTVPQPSWCEDQFAVLSLLLLKDIFASWTRLFPVSIVWPPCSFTSLSFQGYSYFYNTPHLTSVLSSPLQPLYFNTQYFILSPFSELYPAPSRKSSGVQGNLANTEVPTWIWASPDMEVARSRCRRDTKVARTKWHACWIIQRERALLSQKSAKAIQSCRGFTSNFTHIKYLIKDGILCPFYHELWHKDLYVPIDGLICGEGFSERTKMEHSCRLFLQRPCHTHKSS